MSISYAVFCLKKKKKNESNDLYEDQRCQYARLPSPCPLPLSPLPVCLFPCLPLLSPFFFFLLTRPPPRSPLFPYTTLFRSSEDTGSYPRLLALISLSLAIFNLLPFLPQVRRSPATRSEEHTSELQSHVNLVCRLLLEKKKKKRIE